jgi:hypothetical protein
MLARSQRKGATKSGVTAANRPSRNEIMGPKEPSLGGASPIGWALADILGRADYVSKKTSKKTFKKTSRKSAGKTHDEKFIVR